MQSKQGTDVFIEVNRTPVRLYNPREQRWADHFKLADDGVIVPLSSTGEVTVKLLKMNRSPEVAIRKRMVSVGIIRSDSSTQ